MCVCMSTYIYIYITVFIRADLKGTAKKNIATKLNLEHLCSQPGYKKKSYKQDKKR